MAIWDGELLEKVFLKKRWQLGTRTVGVAHLQQFVKLTWHPSNFFKQEN
jgi:hypothetical protein